MTKEEAQTLFDSFVKEGEEGGRNLVVALCLSDGDFSVSFVGPSPAPGDILGNILTQYEEAGYESEVRPGKDNNLIVSVR